MISQIKKRHFVPPQTLYRSTSQSKSQVDSRVSKQTQSAGQTTLPTRFQGTNLTSNQSKSQMVHPQAQTSGRDKVSSQSNQGCITTGPNDNMTIQNNNETILPEAPNQLMSHKNGTFSQHNENFEPLLTRSRAKSFINDITPTHPLQSTDPLRAQDNETHHQSPPQAPPKKRSVVRRHNNGAEIPNAPDKRPTRRACRMVKTNRIVRLSQTRIKVDFNLKHQRATSRETHSLLAHNVGAITCQHCPMDTGYWKKKSDDVKQDLITEVTVNFDIDINVAELYEYIDKMMANRYREFKCELHDYFLEFSSAEEALANPPMEMDGRSGQWDFLCKHFQSERFLKQSNANKGNRKKRPYEHHAGSCPIGYLVEECIEEGSQFPEIDAYEKAYGGKKNKFSSDNAEAKFGEMVSEKNIYIDELAKDYPEGTPKEDIQVLDKDD